MQMLPKHVCWTNEGMIDSQDGGEPSWVPATHSDHVGYLRQPFLIVGSWTKSSGGEEEDTSPHYPST